MPHRELGAGGELDVRGIRKPEKRLRIFAEFDALSVGQSFVLVTDDDPRHLRQEFDTECPGGFGWVYQQRGPDGWRILITKTASTPLPRIVGSTRPSVVADGDEGSEGVSGGAIWKLEMSRRQLDANVIRMLPGERIDEHAGSELDVLVHVLAGAGEALTELDTVPLEPGVLLWLPRHSRRGFRAGSEGLTYLTVHLRRAGLSIAPRSSSAPTSPAGGRTP